MHLIGPRLTRSQKGGGKLAAVALIAVAVVAILTLVVFGAVAFLRSDMGSLPHLLQRLAEIVEGSRGHLPEWLFGAMPGDAESLKAAIIAWLRLHAQELRTLGGELGHVVAYSLIGW